MKEFLGRVVYNFILILIGIGIAHSQLPSDLITYQDAPIKPLSLQHVSPESAKAIDAGNSPLGAWEPMAQFTLGRANSEDSTVLQSWYSNVGIPESLTKFSQAEEPLPASVVENTTAGNVSEFPADFQSNADIMFL
ncbi:MAG TPA: hypothetical protein VN455_02195 [Methanotrichaceae archaeon]|nr:hypothetical protein [Methanotrichaceae archaeon]